MPAGNAKRKHRGLSWELQDLDGSVVMRGGYAALTASRVEITTSGGGKLQVELREAKPGVVRMHVRDNRGVVKGMIEVRPQDGRLEMDLRGDNSVTGAKPRRR